jgi:hypothetical protein
MPNQDEDTKYLASNFRKKDADTKYLASNYKKKEEPKPGWLERNANFAQKYINEPVEKYIRNPVQSGLEAVGGFGQGLANIGPGLANLGISGINSLGANAPKIPMIDVVPHSPGSTLGEIGSFFAPGSALKLLSKAPAFMHTTRAAMKIPMIAESIKHASNILSKAPTASKIAGNALLGGAYAPDNPLVGLGLGAVGGALGEGISKIGSDIYNSPSVKKGLEKTYGDTKNSIINSITNSKLYSKINPTAHAKEIENSLSLGANGVTKNSQELANDVRKAYDSRVAQAEAFYKYPLEKAGNQKIYKDNPLILNKTDESANTLGKIKDLNAGDLYHNFKANPTFNNAHKLQSELGSMERKLESNPIKTQDDYHQIAKIKSAKSDLQNDISRFLERHDKTSNIPLSDKYKKASQLFEEHVVPYLKDKKILEITKGGKTDIKNLHTPFNTPSNVINKNGIEEIGHINKILSDLPESSKNRILFSAIGGNKLNPESLMEKLDEIKSKGYGSYFTPEIDKSINELGKKLRNKRYAKKIGGITGLGASIGGVNSLSHLF